VADEQNKKNATIVKVAGIACGVIVITIGMLSAPKLGNYSMIVVVTGISIAVVAFVGASLRSTKS
jgi:uncharacterized membrane protein YdcZ (DUF606 family)